MHRLIFLLVLISPACQANLYELVYERLSWMQAVAAWKWNRDLPVEDINREAVVIEKGRIAGLQYGITTQSSERFFRAQIEAAKSIQTCWHERWNQGSPTLDTPDLNETIRPELIRLGDAITAELPRHRPDRDAFSRQVVIDCLPAEQAEAIYDAIVAISTYPDRLEQVRSSGVLRVGTTGDYAPFSFSPNGREFTGIDIDMARDLALSLGAGVVFVHTSWPTLMDDLLQGRYDVAMSGVSIIPARQEMAFFSSPYHIGGKTPITRCENAARYSSLDAINQRGVTIIVNPGGTNERFVRSRISEADIIVHDDNRTIFTEIVAGRADLMITDSIEVRLQSARHPALCPGMPGETLSYQEKGYMMPQDSALRAAVNSWLENARTSGLLAGTFETHLR